MKARYFNDAKYQVIDYAQLPNTLRHVERYLNLSSITVKCNKLPRDINSENVNTASIKRSVSEILVHCTTADSIDEGVDQIICDIKAYLTHLVTYSNKDHNAEYTLALLEDVELFCQEQIPRYNLDRRLRFKAHLLIKFVNGGGDQYPSRRLFYSVLDDDDKILIDEAMQIRRELWEEILLLVRKQINSVKINLHQLSPLENVKEIPAPILVQMLHVYWENDYILARADFEKFETCTLTLLGYNKRKYDKAKSEYMGRKKDKIGGLRNLVDSLAQKLNSPKKRPDN